MKNSRTSAFLMANLGSEVFQLFSCSENGDRGAAAAAAERALRVIDELMCRPDMKKRTAEIEILRSIIQSTAAKEKRFVADKSMLEEYFLPFAMRVLYPPRP